MNLDENKLKEALNSTSEKAKNLLNDKEGMTNLLDSLEKKMNQYPKLSEAIDDIKLMVELVKCYVKKEYTQIPLASIVAIVGAIIYVVNPVDLIPDVIPVLGQVDDLGVIALCVKLCSYDINNFKKWKEEQAKKIEELPQTETEL